MRISVEAIPYRLVHSSKGCTVLHFPYICNHCGDKDMYCLSPLHGRSFVVGRTKCGRYIVSKGNGLSYTQYTFLHTSLALQRNIPTCCIGFSMQQCCSLLRLMGVLNQSLSYLLKINIFIF